MSYINDKFPGNHEKNVRYTSVIGSGILGQTSVKSVLFPSKGIFNLLAFVSYFALSGDGKTYGDGIIPVTTANLLGSNLVILDGDVIHSNYLPTPLKSIQVPDATWYGTKEILDKWVVYLK